MRLTIASGKGGTGKTTVATSLAWVLGRKGEQVQYVDCDVEEPNGHLFLKPLIERVQTVGIPTPRIDPDRCTGCGECGQVCRFYALAVLTKALVFPELCHGCGGCALRCPAGALREEDRPIGTIETGHAGAVAFSQGRLNVREPSSPPLIRAVQRTILPGVIAILDAPPGTACPVVAAVRGADYVLLVTEPTPFGLHDLELAIDMVRAMGIPHGVLINRADGGDDRVRRFCLERGISVLMEIPEDRAAAEVMSRGELPVRCFSEWRARFETLWAILGAQRR